MIDAQVLNGFDLISILISILSTAQSGTIMIDSSTIDPIVSKQMAERSEKIGAFYMDAPVSGGSLFHFLFGVCVTSQCCFSSSDRPKISIANLFKKPSY